MNATDILSAEHEVILRMLGALDALAVQVQETKDLDVQTGKDLLHFFVHFADKYHHAKEEDLLFPAMEKAGIPREGGPIGVMLTEHDQGRAAIRSMRDALEKWKAGDELLANQFLAGAEEFFNMLTQHIWKEDNILYPMAGNTVAPEEMERMLGVFQGIKMENVPQGYDDYLHLADVIEQKLGSGGCGEGGGGCHCSHGESESCH